MIRAASLPIAPLLLLMLGGCEFIVDPVHEQTSASTGQTTVGNGSLATSGSTSSASTQGSGSGSLGSGSTTAGSTSSSAASSSGGTTGCSSDFCTATCPGLQGICDASCQCVRNSGSCDDFCNGCTAQGFDCQQAHGDCTCVDASSSSSSASGSSGASSSSTGLSSSTTTGSAGTTGITATTSIGTSTGATASTSIGTSTGTTATTATTTSIGTSTGTTATTSTSLGTSTGTIGTTALSTSGSSGSTGGCTAQGTTGAQGLGCSANAGGPPAPAPQTDWVTTLQPDSLSTCGSTCPGVGSDEDYRFPVSTLCPVGAYSFNGSSFFDPFESDSLTGVQWEQGLVGGGDLTNAELACVKSMWTGSDGGHPDIGVPHASQLIGLLDFSGGDGGLLTGNLNGNGMQLVGGAGNPTSGTMASYTVDFASGEFGPTISQPRTNVKCVLGTYHAVAVTQSCSLTTFGNDCGITENGVNNTGLVFRSPATTAFFTFDQALSYCASLDVTCGAYRLPSYKELATLVNFNRGLTAAPLIDSLHGNMVLWSSTPSPLDPSADGMAISFANSQLATQAPASSGFAQSRATPSRVLCVKN